MNSVAWVGFLLPLIVSLPARCVGTARYQILELDTPAGAESYATAVDNNGHVAGRANGRAVVWRNGKPTDLGTLGQEFSSASGINSKVQVVGTAYSMPSCHKPSHGFIWSDGSAKDVGYLKRPPANACGINNSGQVVGWSFSDEGSERAFLWSSQEGMRDLGYLRYYKSMAYAINNGGQVVGESADRAFIWQNGKMTDLGVLDGMESSRARAINDRGQIVGSSYNAGYYDKKRATRACLWQDGKITDLGTLGGEWSDAYAINNRRQVVGASGISGGELGRQFTHAFIWQDGKMVDLNDLIPADSAFVLREARAINDVGQIAGDGEVKGRNRAFLLTPRP